MTVWAEVRVERRESRTAAAKDVRSMARNGERSQGTVLERSQESQAMNVSQDSNGLEDGERARWYQVVSSETMIEEGAKECHKRVR